MTLTTTQAFCTLRTPFDIVFNALFRHVSHPIQPSHKYIHLFNYAHNSDPRGSPDMILTAFDVKLREKQNNLPPEA